MAPFCYECIDYRHRVRRADFSELELSKEVIAFFFGMRYLTQSLNHGIET